MIDPNRMRNNASEDLKWFLARSRSSKVRTMREFAEQEIVIPDGPFAGRRFRCSRQPYTGLLFDAIDSGQWNRIVATGPTQSGKTLSCFVVPTFYHLFEIGETVICGLPDMDMAADKWREDLLPVIECTAFRDLIPKTGAGSRGGKIETIQFLNGATLKFMSGGGGDKSRAGFTSRVIVITETDGMDTQGVASREADKITQLEARSRAYGDRKRIYMECTVSTEDGRTWREYQDGTASRIALRCSHCQSWVTPEREHFAGWQSCESQIEAKRTGRFFCPDCGELWTEDDRLRANQECKLLHRDQFVNEKGSVDGEAPETDTLGFRWSAVNNSFQTSGDLAADEWRAARDADEENAEREMRQFVWCIPVEPTKWDHTSLSASLLAGRIGEWPRGIAPPDTRVLTTAVDLGKYLAHWITVAWQPNATSHIIDYGRLEIASDDVGVEQAIIVTLRQFRDQLLAGWPVRGEDGKTLVPGQVWIDAGYMTDVVYQFCLESGRRFHPSFGRGVEQQRQTWSGKVTRTGSVITLRGEGYHVAKLKDSKIQIVEVDADHWKTWVHERLATPLEKPGHMTLFKAKPEVHFSLARHLTAETKTEEFLSGKGVVTKWERIRRQNHWFDALYNACAAGHSCKVRLIGKEAKLDPPPRSTSSSQARSQREWINPNRAQRAIGRRGGNSFRLF